MEVRIDLGIGQKIISTLSGKLPQATRAAFVETGVIWVNRMTKERLSGRPGLKRRTGAASRALFYNASPTSLIVGTDNTAPYLPVHEGTPPGTPTIIKGKPWLWIPLENNQTKAGVVRFSPKDAFTVLEDTFWHTSPAGNPVLISRSRGPLFVKVLQVKIPARLGATKMLEQMPPVFVARLKAKLDAV